MNAPNWGSIFSKERFDTVAWIRDMCAQVDGALGRRFDASQRKDSAYFLAPDLEQLLVDVFEIRYPDLKAAELVPMRSVADGAADIRYRSLDMTGTGKWLGPGSNDLPRADVSKSEASIMVQTCGMSFGYTIDELAAAAFAQQPLERDRAMACRKLVERTADEALCMGSSLVAGTSPVFGLLNQDLYTTDPVEIISLTTGTWITASSVNIHKDISQMRRKMRLDTKGTSEPTHVGLPTELWAHLTGVPWGTDNNPKTIMAVLKENFPGITFFEWPRLDTADAAFTGGRVVMLSQDPLNFWWGSARPFTPEQPQAHGLEFEVPCHKRQTRGIAVPFSKTIKYADNAI